MTRLVGWTLCLSACAAPPDPLVLPLPKPDLMVSIISATYTSYLDRDDAPQIGRSFSLPRLEQADLEALAASAPLIVLWIGGAEHAELLRWLDRFAAELPNFEQRGANLLLLRPLGRERTGAFAESLGLQIAVASDESHAFLQALGFETPPQWGVFVFGRERELLYLKYADRLPGPEEVDAVLDGRDLACCPLVCDLACVTPGE